MFVFKKEYTTASFGEEKIDTKLSSKSFSRLMCFKNEGKSKYRKVNFLVFEVSKSDSCGLYGIS